MKGPVPYVMALAGAIVLGWFITRPEPVTYGPVPLLVGLLLLLPLASRSTGGWRL